LRDLNASILVWTSKDCAVGQRQNRGDGKPGASMNPDEWSGLMAYVDGFLLPVPKRKIKAYVEISRKAGKIWKEHGALEYRECVGDDLKIKNMTGFPKVAKTRSGETVVFSWIVYKSRAHRDAVNKKVMKDERLATMMDPKEMPFDVKRMAMGGFKVAVDL
jgi:uncharacterized protein YbaA (DUF1428 family)